MVRGKKRPYDVGSIIFISGYGILFSRVIDLYGVSHSWC